MLAPGSRINMKPGLQALYNNHKCHVDTTGLANVDQCWPSVADDGPTFSQRWPNALYLLDCHAVLSSIIPDLAQRFAKIEPASMTPTQQ